MTARKRAGVVMAFMILTLSFSIFSMTGQSYFASATEGEQDEHYMMRELGHNSHVELGLSAESKIAIDIMEGDLADGEYTVSFKCTDPEISLAFPDYLKVHEGNGELVHRLALKAGMYHDCTLYIGDLSATFDSFTILVEEEHADDAIHDEKPSYVIIEKKIGQHSELHFKAEGGSGILMIEIREGDLPDGSYNVTIACHSPDTSVTFSNKLVVADGKGGFDGKLRLRSDTYSECMVNASRLSVVLPDFTVVANETTGHSHGTQDRTESRVVVSHDGIVSFEVMVTHPGFTAGVYDALVTCEEPAGFSIAFNDAFVMDRDGRGKFRAETMLGPRDYAGCKVSIQEGSDAMVIASLERFRVVEDGITHEDDNVIEQKRIEKRHNILQRVSAEDIHRRHVDAARASSTGQYMPGTAYSLTAAGTLEGHDDMMSVAEVTADMGVWKSNRAVILMDVLGGSVVVGDHSYTIHLGYAVYSIHHDALRVNGLATDDVTGDIVRLKLLGMSPEDVTFPMVEGEAIELHFEGNSHRFSNQIGNWELFLDGTIEA